MLDNSSLVLMASVHGASLSSEERDFFNREQVSGVTLFERNFTDDLQLSKQLTSELQSLNKNKDATFLIAIDQEGGRVTRIRRNFPDLGPALNLEGGSVEGAALKKIEQYAHSVAQALVERGVNINFAPVVDILTRESNKAIGDRAFGKDLETVTCRAKSFLLGLQMGGIKGCLKHFPGQGDAPYDTHARSATIEVNEEILWQREIRAFAQLLPNCDLVMISHCIYPALDSQPATFSKKIMQNILRKKLGFAGVIVSDDMLMAAIPQDLKSWQESLVTTIAAGTDLLLVCKDLERARYALEALRNAERSSPAFRERLAEAAARVVHFRRRVAPVFSGTATI